MGDWKWYWLERGRKSPLNLEIAWRLFYDMSGPVPCLFLAQHRFGKRGRVGCLVSAFSLPPYLETHTGSRVDRVLLQNCGVWNSACLPILVPVSPSFQRLGFHTRLREHWEKLPMKGIFVGWGPCLTRFQASGGLVSSEERDRCIDFHLKVEANISEPFLPFIFFSSLPSFFSLFHFYFVLVVLWDISLCSSGWPRLCNLTV